MAAPSGDLASANGPPHWRESTAVNGLEQSQVGYNKEASQIRFDITKSLMRGEVYFPPFLPPAGFPPGPQVAALPLARTTCVTLKIPTSAATT